MVSRYPPWPSSPSAAPSARPAARPRILQSDPRSDLRSRPDLPLRHEVAEQLPRLREVLRRFVPEAPVVREEIGDMSGVDCFLIPVRGGFHVVPEEQHDQVHEILPTDLVDLQLLEDHVRERDRGGVELQPPVPGFLSEQDVVAEFELVEEDVDVEPIFALVVHEPTGDGINGFFGDRRIVYYEGKNRFHVDVFLDKLEFSHDVLFGKKPGNGRLELDSPTISLTDMVLEKLQIHQIGRKDLVDLIVLFLGHDVKPSADGDREAIDAGHIANLLADDWGFWYESTQNLTKSRQLLGNFVAEGKIPTDFAARIENRIGKLEAALRSVPKGRHWEKRAKVGTAKPWFREVEEIVR